MIWSSSKKSSSFSVFFCASLVLFGWNSVELFDLTATNRELWFGAMTSPSFFPGRTKFIWLFKYHSHFGIKLRTKYDKWSFELWINLAKSTNICRYWSIKNHTHTQNHFYFWNHWTRWRKRKKHNKRTHTLRMSNRIVNEFVFSLVVVFFILFLVKIIIVKIFVWQKETYSIACSFILYDVFRRRRSKNCHEERT